MKNYRGYSRLDGESSLGPNIVRADNRYWYHGNAAFHRQVERSLLEGQQFAVERAMAFDVNRHI